MLDLAHETETQLREKIELRRALDLLRSNESFIQVIESGFIKEYCLTAAHNYGNLALDQVSGVRNPSNIITAVGCLKHYFTIIETEAAQAETKLNNK